MVATTPEDSPFDVHRPFTRADAVAAGIDPKVLRTSRFRRIFRGVYIDARVPDSPFVRARAALVIHPKDAFASHTTAARVYKLPLPANPLEHVTVARPQDRRYRAEIRNHVTSHPPMVIVHRGLRLSHPFQMFIELASMLSLVDLVVVGDALVRVFDVEADQLVAACRRSGEKHAGAALRAAEYVREGVDSPMETRLRLLIVLAGLPEPRVNHELRAMDGRVTRRLDLSYPLWQLIIEYDGRQHVERIDQWESDLDRREEFDGEGWHIVVVTSKGIYGRPDLTLGRICKALRACGCRVPARLRSDWQAHFPVHG